MCSALDRLQKKGTCLTLPTADTSCLHGCQCSQPCKTEYILLPGYWDAEYSGPELVDVLEKLTIELWSLMEKQFAYSPWKDTGQEAAQSTYHWHHIQWSTHLMGDKARHRSLVQKGIQREVYLADSCLALLLTSQLAKAYVSSGSEVSVWISTMTGTLGFTLQWNVCLHMVSDSSFVGAALPAWSCILPGKNEHTYRSLNIVIGRNIVSLSSPVLKCRIRSNFQCLRPPWHLASQL